MKRKRGRKGKSKNTPNAGISDADPSIDNLSDDDVSSEDDIQKDETNLKMDIETPSTEAAQPEKPAAVSATEVTIKPVGKVYNRLKVKIKSSKPLEPQVTSSDAQEPQVTSSDAHTHSDTDKSSQHISLDKQVVIEKVEDSANLVPVGNVGASTTQPKKTGSIKIKSSKGFGSSLSPCNNTGVPLVEETHQKEPESLSRDFVYNKQELNASLEVIMRIMKTDASEPFNAPVNPVALGIPDYFDVIKTPMDFGTIRSNLESGVKYKNSEDVYKDVQFIWDNCYKYNNKGDYILELMKRVKKNFMKNWAAAGLYTQQGDLKDGNISSQGKSSSKSGHSKHKSKKRHGFKRHKDDCLCAICIMVRRRQEREKGMNPADDRDETSDGLGQEVKFEGTSAPGSPNADDTSSSSDNSQNEDADTEMEDKREEVKLEKELQSTSQSKQQEEKEKEKPFETNKENSIAEQSQIDGKSGIEKNKDIQMMEAGNATKNDANNGDEMIQHENGTAIVENQKPKELIDAGTKAKLLKTLHQRYDNPMVMDLCASLFPENPKSLWNRPHSLVHRHGSSHKSSIGAAITTFLKY